MNFAVAWYCASPQGVKGGSTSLVTCEGTPKDRTLNTRPDATGDSSFGCILGARFQRPVRSRESTDWAFVSAVAAAELRSI